MERDRDKESDKERKKGGKEERKKEKSIINLKTDKDTETMLLATQHFLVRTVQM